MSVSGRRLTRVMAEYIRARHPIKITPAELYAAMKIRGYLRGSKAACLSLVYRKFNALMAEMQKNG